MRSERSSEQSSMVLLSDFFFLFLILLNFATIKLMNKNKIQSVARKVWVIVAILVIISMLGFSLAPLF